RQQSSSIDFTKLNSNCGDGGGVSSGCGFMAQRKSSSKVHRSDPRVNGLRIHTSPARSSSKWVNCFAVRRITVRPPDLRTGWNTVQRTATVLGDSQGPAENLLIGPAYQTAQRA